MKIQVVLRNGDTIIANISETFSDFQKQFIQLQSQSQHLFTIDAIINIGEILYIREYK